MRSQNVVRSTAELESFLSIPNSSIFGLLLYLDRFLTDEVKADIRNTQRCVEDQVKIV